MINIGDILAVPEGTLNPYTAKQAFGRERSKLLGAFLRYKPTPGVEFWHAPVQGGAYKLQIGDIVRVDPEAVNYYWDAGGNPHR